MGHIKQWDMFELLECGRDVQLKAEIAEDLKDL